MICATGAVRKSTAALYASLCYGDQCSHVTFCTRQTRGGIKDNEIVEWRHCCDNLLTRQCLLTSPNLNSFAQTACRAASLASTHSKGRFQHNQKVLYSLRSFFRCHLHGQVLRLECCFLFTATPLVLFDWDQEESDKPLPPKDQRWRSGGRKWGGIGWANGREGKALIDCTSTLKSLSIVCILKASLEVFYLWLCWF